MSKYLLVDEFGTDLLDSSTIEDAINEAFGKVLSGDWPNKEVEISFEICQMIGTIPVPVIGKTIVLQPNSPFS